jgi:hypothetical protein
MFSTRHTHFQGFRIRRHLFAVWFQAFDIQLVREFLSSETSSIHRQGIRSRNCSQSRRFFK